MLMPNKENVCLTIKILKMKDLKEELDFVQLEERLEMVNLAHSAAAQSACATVHTGCCIDCDVVDDKVIVK